MNEDCLAIWILALKQDSHIHLVHGIESAPLGNARPLMKAFAMSRFSEFGNLGRSLPRFNTNRTYPQIRVPSSPCQLSSRNSAPCHIICDSRQQRCLVKSVAAYVMLKMRLCRPDRTGFKKSNSDRCTTSASRRFPMRNQHLPQRT